MRRMFGIIRAAPADNTGLTSTSVVALPQNFSDIRYVSGVAGRPFQEVLGPGDCCAADSPRAQAATPPPAAANAPVAAAGPSTGSGRAGGAGAPAGRGGGGGGLAVDGPPPLRPPDGVV